MISADSTFAFGFAPSKLTEKFILGVVKTTTFNYVEFSFPVNDPAEFSRRGSENDHVLTGITLMKGNFVFSLVSSTDGVHVEQNCWLDVARDEVVSTNQKQRWHWWMMAGLFSVNRASVNETLIGLSQNRVEGFCHVDVEEKISDGKTDGGFHPFKWSWGDFVLEEMRSIGHSFA
jgi:hypothetical protein